MDADKLMIAGSRVKGLSMGRLSLAETLRQPDQTKLVFDRVGDQYFLSEIFEEGSNVGVELKKSPSERQLEKEGAMSEPNSVSVPGHSGVNARR